MDPPIPTPAPSSTVTSFSTSSSAAAAAAPPTPFQLLEISLISAQDLSTVTKSMRTYAVTWIHPNRKLTTRTDQHGHTNPTWNEKFEFRLDNESLTSEDTTVTVEIYTVSWFRDILVGTVRVLMTDLLTPSARVAGNNHLKRTRFVALQVRRSSGNPQGILNMGVALLDSTMRSMPLKIPPTENFSNTTEKKANSPGQKNEPVEGMKEEINAKNQLWRSLSTGFDEMNIEDFHVKAGSMVNGSICNGSVVNGSELCSDIGPSASIVAAEMTHKSQPPVVRPSNQKRNVEDEETGSSILEDLTIEEARAKGYRIRSRESWRKETLVKDFNSDDSCDQSELLNDGRRGRRNSDGGLFSCFGTAYRIEFRIVCGASKNDNNKGKSGKSKKPGYAISA